MRSRVWLGALRCVCVITATIEKLRESDVKQQREGGRRNRRKNKDADGRHVICELRRRDTGASSKQQRFGP
jgi:hypothetical protein